MNHKVCLAHGIAIRGPAKPLNVGPIQWFQSIAQLLNYTTYTEMVYKRFDQNLTMYNYSRIPLISTITVLHFKNPSRRPILRPINVPN